ncbi:MAG: 16S rRNA (guanine(527)-N(7))-methyltransferase RsmG [Lentisphaeria bacterium]|nr:16S rRNA (guanine(527)-N(7))-methyltransferase RsmG [Lentisphaeria bacterium]
MAVFLPPPDDAERAFLLECVGTDRLDAFLTLCTRYGELLYETNESLNLTAIPPEAYWSKHVCDCVLALRALPDLFADGVRIADVGCGAGLPAFPLAAARPMLDVTAIDSRGKKVAFLERAASDCGLSNLHPVHARANELAAQEKYRGAFRTITARAVAGAPELVRECRNLLGQGGSLCVFRTESQAADEWPALLADKRVRAERTPEFILPHDAGTRLFLRIRKP